VGCTADDRAGKPDRGRRAGQRDDRVEAEAQRQPAERDLRTGFAFVVADQRVGQSQAARVGGAAGRHTQMRQPMAAQVLDSRERARLDDIDPPVKDLVLEIGDLERRRLRQTLDRTETHPLARCQQRGRLAARIPRHRGRPAEQAPAARRCGGVDRGQAARDGYRPTAGGCPAWARPAPDRGRSDNRNRARTRAIPPGTRPPDAGR
jgi:hypothetical protein